MRIASIGAAATVAISALASVAGADMLPAGYSGPALTSGTTADYLDISQLAFNPADPDHLYAVRFNFGQTSSVITRYDYSAATGQISDPLTVATVPGAALGLAFSNNNLYVSQSNLTTDLGGITRLTPNGDGTYGSPVSFINNIPVGEHQVDPAAARDHPDPERRRRGRLARPALEAGNGDPSHGQTPLSSHEIARNHMRITAVLG